MQLDGFDPAGTAGLLCELGIEENFQSFFNSGHGIVIPAFKDISALFITDVKLDVSMRGRRYHFEYMQNDDPGIVLNGRIDGIAKGVLRIRGQVGGI
jgi:hypothetical protein